MPCYDPGPSERELRQQDVAKLTLDLDKRMGEPPSQLATMAAKTSYGCAELDKLTAALCRRIRNFSEEQLNRFVYDGRNPEARKLADWWDAHKEVDAMRHGRLTPAQSNALRELRVAMANASNAGLMPLLKEGDHASLVDDFNELLLDF